MKLNKTKERILKELQESTSGRRKYSWQTVHGPQRGFYETGSRETNACRSLEKKWLVRIIKREKFAGEYPCRGDYHCNGVELCVEIIKEVIK